MICKHPAAPHKEPTEGCTHCFSGLKAELKYEHDRAELADSAMTAVRAESAAMKRAAEKALKLFEPGPTIITRRLADYNAASLELKESLKSSSVREISDRIEHLERLAVAARLVSKWFDECIPLISPTFCWQSSPGGRSDAKAVAEFQKILAEIPPRVGA